MIYRFGHWQLDSSARELWRAGQRVNAARRVFDLLLYLLERRERAVGRDELVAAVWGKVDVADVQVSQLIARARRQLDDDAQNQTIIRTIAGFGYRWVAQLQEPAASSEAAVGTAATSLPACPSPVPPDRHDRLTAVDTAAPVRNRRWVALASLCSLLVAAVVWLCWPVQPSSSDAGLTTTLAVLPLEVEGTSDDDWIRLGGMDLISSRLRRGGALVIPSESLLASLHAAGPSFSATTVQWNHGAGPVQTVHGRAVRHGQHWQIRLRTTAVDGRLLEVQVEAAEPMPAAGRATDQLLQQLGLHALRAERGDDLADHVQRIRAAILVADLAGARAALTQVPEPLLSHSRMRLIQAELDFHSGQLDASARKLDALLADTELTTREHARVLLARGMLTMRMGECAAAEQRFTQALSSEIADHEARSINANAWAGRGLARTCSGQLQAAADDLGLARLHMDALRDRLGVARVDNYLGVLELRRGMPQRALEHFQVALSSFDALAVIDAQRAVLSGMLDAQMQLLDWDAAEATAQRLLELREQISDPWQQQILDSERARVLIATGQLRAARTLLDSAARLPPRGSAQRLLAATRAELHWREGDAAGTLVQAREALASWPAGDHDHRYLRLLLMAQQAALAITSSAPAIPDELSLQGADAALHTLLLARQASAEGAPERAHSLYETALRHAEQQGIPATLLWVIADFAGRQLQQGQLQAASGLIGRVLHWAERDFDAALLRTTLFHSRNDTEAWARSLATTRQLAGERQIPPHLLQPPQSSLVLSGTAVAEP